MAIFHLVTYFILGSTLATTSGQPRSILPNVESRVQQMMPPEARIITTRNVSMTVAVAAVEEKLNGAVL